MFFSTDSQLVIVLEDIVLITEKRIEMFYVYHVRISFYIQVIKKINVYIKIILLLAADNFRPYLTSFQGSSFTDYINCVFVDVSTNYLRLFIFIYLIKFFLFYLFLQGYTRPREYIVTEWPLKHTVGEFWSLVYDHECSAVVVLCAPPPNSVSLEFNFI